MRLDPLITRSPMTGAVRHVTEDLLREVYLAPAFAGFPLQEALTDRKAPWSESLSLAPLETTAAIEAALISVMRATGTLDHSALHPDMLPEGRARNHLTRLRDLWRDIGALPAPLGVYAHVLKSHAANVLEPLPMLDAKCAHADPVSYTHLTLPTIYSV